MQQAAYALARPAWPTPGVNLVGPLAIILRLNVQCLNRKDDCRLADVLLHNLWRWVGSPKSAMYSQSLHLAVSALQRKMLAQLVRSRPSMSQDCSCLLSADTIMLMLVTVQLTRVSLGCCFLLLADS